MKKKSKKITISKGSPQSNMKIMANMRQSSAVIIGEVQEPVMYEAPKKEKK